MIGTILNGLRDDGAVQKTAPPNRPNRRRYLRVYDNFPVLVRDARLGKLGRKVGAVAREFDFDCIRIRCRRALPVGRRVELRFKIPASLSSTLAGIVCRFKATVRECRRPDSSRPDVHELVLEWEKRLSELIAERARKRERRISLIFYALIAFMIVWRIESLEYFWYTPVYYVYSILIGVFFLTRFLLMALYRPPPLSDYEPSLSIVISVRNEEEGIARTIQTCFDADYPDEKREVIVVNDGSTDKTAQVVERLTKVYPKLRFISIPPSGKRDGMATGVRMAAGELIVFVDSDTFIYPTALRYIVSGFEDPTLGAVSGHTDVENARQNALTALQEVRYFLSFRMMKTAESLFGVVTCCPGCLSAYRKSYLLEILEPWLHQRFLGAKATFGDDRSLTNFILQKYRVVYNENAIGSTMVPDTWRRYMTQQVRWKKSWLRETMRVGMFMWRKHPIGAISFYVSSICSVMSPFMVARAVYIGVMDKDGSFENYLLGMIALGMVQCVYFLKKRPSGRWLLGMLMVATQAVIMGPQTYYAILTMRKNHWGTR